jgi:hypothetical protein
MMKWIIIKANNMKSGIRGRRMNFGTDITASMPRSDKHVQIKLRAIKHETKSTLAFLLQKSLIRFSAQNWDYCGFLYYHMLGWHPETGHTFLVHSSQFIAYSHPAIWRHVSYPVWKASLNTPTDKRILKSRGIDKINVKLRNYNGDVERTIW